ncbi:hypothetical protein HZI73_14725 [Vallitalea pronyensis]|uniref:Uncharacterized protein n=1 Tax=Vallitalea pronyensis TaxID=1348613 RepID=A0A8J8ML12_9FIRM|nr:hypothetical protein [Vallitalea pronyensis]QUI23461.1 hypothetical protein HZI73_14725 [Vallitalea pronyensis]
MKLDNPYSQIFINNRSGEKWRFYIFDKKLFYRIIQEDGTDNKKVELMDNVKNFDITVDSQDNLHVVYSCYNGEFCYLKYSSNVWSKSTFYEANGKFEIDFINILTHHDTIHIFYTYKNNKNNRYYKLYHIYTLDNQWTYTSLAQIPLSKEAKPYFVDHDVNGGILLVFRARFQKLDKVYFKTYKTQHAKWSTSTELKLTKRNTLIKNFLIDSKGNYHFIYHDNTHVCYVSHLPNDVCSISDAMTFNYLKDLGNNVTVAYQLFEADHKLWMSSMDGHELHYFTSDNWGKDWDEIKEKGVHDLCQTKFINTLHGNVGMTKPIMTLCSSSDEGTCLLGLNDVGIREKLSNMVNKQTDDSAVKDKVKGESTLKEKDNITDDSTPIKDIQKTTDDSKSIKDINETVHKPMPVLDNDMIIDETMPINEKDKITDESDYLNDEDMVGNTSKDTLFDVLDDTPIEEEPEKESEEVPKQVSKKESILQRIIRFFRNF